MGDQASIIDLLGAYDNLDEPVPSWNHDTTIIPTIVVFLVINYTCVIFRLYTRFRIVHAPGWDDFFVVLVMMTGTTGSICICLATQHGMGQHFLLLTAAERMKYLNLFYVANASYAMSTTFVKLALLFQYFRLFKSEPRIWWVCISLATFTSLWGLVYSFMAWFPCFPVQAYWTSDPTAHCYGYGSLDANSFFGTYASWSLINMMLDIVILIIPVPLYFRKDTQQRTKLGLVGLLFMGGLVNFLSIWRVATIIQSRAATWPTFDPTWYGPISILLATIEVDMATICASIPIFWPVLTAKLDKIFVTQEIKIEREHRFLTMEDEYELHRTPSDNEAYRLDLMHSRGTSQSSLTPKESRMAKAAQDGNFTNKYTIDQIDPLTNEGTVQSEITAQPMPARKHSKAGMSSA